MTNGRHHESRVQDDNKNKSRQIEIYGYFIYNK